MTTNRNFYIKIELKFKNLKLKISIKIKKIRQKKMEYRKLGNTDLELSVITHGAFAIGGNMWGGNEKQDSINSIHGYRTILRVRIE